MDRVRKNRRCLLLNVLGTEIYEELPLYNASVVDDYGWFANLQIVK